MKTLIVHVEGTLTDRELTREPHAALVEALFNVSSRGGWKVVLVSFHASTTPGLKRVQDWLLTHNVPHDELWASWGYPEGDVIINSEAVRITDKSTTDNILSKIS